MVRMMLILLDISHHRLPLSYIFLQAQSDALIANAAKEAEIDRLHMNLKHYKERINRETDAEIALIVREAELYKALGCYAILARHASERSGADGNGDELDDDVDN